MFTNAKSLGAQTPSAPYLQSLVHLSSAKRTSGNSSSWTTTFTDRIKHIRKLEFYNINIPYTWYDFNDGNLDIGVIGGHLISIAAGTYTPTTIKQAIEAAAIAAGTSTTVTYAPSGVFSITGISDLRSGALTLGSLSSPIFSNELVFRGSNRSICITIDGIDYVAYVTAGNYNNLTLAKEIQTQLTNLGGWNSLYVTYSKNTDRITFAGTRTVAPTTITISRSKSTIADYIGLMADITTSGASINVTLHRSPIKPCRYLTIRSNTIASIAYGPHPYKHYCAKIIIDQPPFFYINFDIPTPHQIDASKGQNITGLDFTLLDQDGVVVDLNGFNWSLAIIIYN